MMRTLVITGASLVALAVASWVIDVPALSLVIAVVKAVWIGWIFMELNEAHVVPRTLAVVALVFIVLLMSGTMADVALRG